MAQLLGSTWMLCGVPAHLWGTSWRPKEQERKNKLLPWLWSRSAATGHQVQRRLEHPSVTQRHQITSNEHPGGTMSPQAAPSAHRPGDSTMAALLHLATGQGRSAAHRRLTGPGIAVCFGQAESWEEMFELSKQETSIYACSPASRISSAVSLLGDSVTSAKKQSKVSKKNH